LATLQRFSLFGRKVILAAGFGPDLDANQSAEKFSCRA
jgi:hypothetical protein